MQSLRLLLRSITTRSTAAIAPLSVAELRALDKKGVEEWANSLIQPEDACKLRIQAIDGEALLEITEDKLRSCGMRLGPAATIARAVAEAQTATLTVYPPQQMNSGDFFLSPYKVTLTPADFRIKYVLSGAPLRLVSLSGVVLQELMTLEQAVEASRDGYVRLHASRSCGDDLGA